MVLTAQSLGRDKEEVCSPLLFYFLPQKIQQTAEMITSGAGLLT
jgi:hypothetical protein